jgi:hypothetical protein
LKISETPALTWGTATYVTPLTFPLSSALYGRIGLVTDFDPGGWRIFDATSPAARMAYIRWVQAQPVFSDLVLTVHSTYANHMLRNQFREDFRIDCVLFHTDQEAEIHTDRSQHVWMAVTDWAGLPGVRRIGSQMSARLAHARFTVLLDEDFVLEQSGLLCRRPADKSKASPSVSGTPNAFEVSSARRDPALTVRIVKHYQESRYEVVMLKTGSGLFRCQNWYRTGRC